MSNLLLEKNRPASPLPSIVRTIADLRATVAQWRKTGERIALVPTMGALHDGHISLTRTARQHGDRVIVSIFVNPTQFAPHEDFAKYPRTFEADASKLAEAGVDAIFSPEVETIYPKGFATSLHMEGPAKAGLEDRFRPDHFDGVATVVSKLHIAVAPDVAVYGEKDFQQLAVIRQMNRDLALPVEVIGSPTVRADDGLALSSRNAYLSAAERATAPLLHATLQDCATQIRAGADVAETLATGLNRLGAAGFKPDYLEFRDAQTLGKPALAEGRDGRLLVAAKLGQTRLIDNIAVPAA